MLQIIMPFFIIYNLIPYLKKILILFLGLGSIVILKKR